MDYKNIKLSLHFQALRLDIFVHLLIIYNAMLFFVIIMLVIGMN